MGLGTRIAGDGWGFLGLGIRDYGSRHVLMARRHRFGVLRWGFRVGACNSGLKTLNPKS